MGYPRFFLAGLHRFTMGPMPEASRVEKFGDIPGPLHRCLKCGMLFHFYDQSGLYCTESAVKVMPKDIAVENRAWQRYRWQGVPVNDAMTDYINSLDADNRAQFMAAMHVTVEGE